MNTKTNDNYFQIKIFYYILIISINILFAVYLFFDKKEYYNSFLFFITFIIVCFLYSSLKNKFDELKNNNDDLKEKLKNQNTIKYEKMKKFEELKMNFPIGTKVIFITNQPNFKSDDVNELIKGEIVGYDLITKAQQGVLVYKDYKDNKEHFSFHTPYYWNEDMEKALLKLNWAERFTIFSKGNHTLDEEYKDRREKTLIEENKLK